MKKQIFPGIIVDPKTKLGKPVIKGTRVPVALVLAELANGMNVKELTKEYHLTQDQVFAALRYAHATVSNEEIVTI